MNSPQLPLALRSPPVARFESFVGSPLVVEALRAAAEGAASDWLFIAGGNASGKTHLLLATLAHATALQRAAAYVPLAAARGRAAALLAQRESNVLICIDGIEAVAGERSDEVALFDLHNRARAAGSVVIYAAAAAPGSLPLLLPDLVSRLAQCTRFLLDPLDDAGRREVLQRRARQRGLELDAAVLDFLLRRVGRDLATLTALLDRIDRASLAARRRVTVPFLRGLLESDAGP